MFKFIPDNDSFDVDCKIVAYLKLICYKKVASRRMETYIETWSKNRSEIRGPDSLHPCWCNGWANTNPPSWDRILPPT